MNVLQQPLTFACENERLVGIVSRPQQPRARGVLIVVGGPQYRVGSHRQFALLAAHLAGQGTPVMRFDSRGMGDSSGDRRDFEHVTHDLRAAVDAFFDAVKEVRDIVIWGLCDAASAALFYAHQDRRVSGVALLNPWVRTAEGEAKAYLQHYYLQRLLSPAPWVKLLRGEFDLRESAKSLATNLRKAREASLAIQPSNPQARTRSLPERMADGLARFDGKILMILSGNDLTALEFKDAVRNSKRWRDLLDSPRVTWRELPKANHTFSTRDWRDQAAVWTADWVRSW